MTSVDLDVAGWSGRGGDTGRLHAVVGSTLQLVNDAIKRVDDRMGRVRGVPGIGYVDRSWQIGEVARQLAVLDGYVRELPADIGGMDHELYARLAGSDCPAHNLSQIHVGDFTASNVGGVRAWGVDVDGAQRWVELDRLRFIDFTGADPGVEAVDGFSGIFHDMYQVWLGRPAHPEDVGLAGYVEGLVASGEFGHRGYHPVGDFITGLLDFTVVWPVVKAVAGHDPIVDEDLGEWERVLGVGMAVADLVALVLALPTGGGSLAGPGLLRAGLGSAARMLLVNALATGVSMLTYDVAIVLDLPPWVAALVAVGMGVAISVVGGKYVLQRLDKHGRPIGEATMVDIGPPKQTVLDDVARPGVKPVAENLAAHGIDPRGVNPREVTLAHITDDISHSPNFEKASTDWQTVFDTNTAAMEARNNILKDLHDNHGITISKREIQGSRAAETIDDLIDSATESEIVDRLKELRNACDKYHDTQVELKPQSEVLGSAGGDDLMPALGVTETHGGPGIGKGSFDKWGPTTDRSEMVYLEEKGGTSKLNPKGRTLPDGTEVPQGTTMYFMDVAKNDKYFLEWAKDPANADMVQGLKDGTVTPRYILSESPGTGATRVSDIVLNPDYLDWSWLPGGK